MHATLTVLGSGTSMGVPTIGCDCATCRSADPHDRRTRPSITVQYGGKLVLIDTTPDFREQALREGIRKIDAILYTHGHADHILGLDDVRPLSFPRITGGPKIPLYANKKTGRVLQHIFKYIFDDDYKFGSIAQVELHEIDHHPIELFGATFTPVPVIHGETEISASALAPPLISPTSARSRKPPWKCSHGLDILFLDALRHKPHPTHSTVENSISIVQKLAAEAHLLHSHLARSPTRRHQPPAACEYPTRTRWAEARVRDLNFLMKIFRSLDDIPAGFGPAVVSIGNFDGVHRAHQRVLEALVHRAHQLRGRAIAVTFDPHPTRILRPDVAPKLIMPLELRLQIP